MNFSREESPEEFEVFNQLQWNFVWIAWRVLQKGEVLTRIRNFLIVSTTEKRLCSSLNCDNVDTVWSCSQNVRTDNESWSNLENDNVLTYVLCALLIEEASIPVSQKIIESCFIG